MTCRGGIVLRYHRQAALASPDDPQLKARVGGLQAQGEILAEL